jgi:acetylornithine deacetylase/succinyl-diaminopimelate desuccinylase-like protein
MQPSIRHRLTKPLAHARSATVRGRWLRELGRLLAFPSISAERARRGDVAATATWLADHLRQIGLDTARVLPPAAGGAPSVYGEWLGAPGRPTLLIYGHFDVQPPGDPAMWRTPPFHPTIIGQHIYARGASDDKGQLFIHLKALESYMAGEGLPLNIKVWLEGEEEIGSPTLPALLDREAERLRADAMLISDTEMNAVGRPSITYGLRGSLVCEVELHARDHDVHSGRYGGAALNPLQALCALLAGLHDAYGRVTIPGFYRHVRSVSAADRRALRHHGRSDTAMIASLGGPPTAGEQGYTLFERATIRPALNITGISGGSVGPGARSSLPAKAVARLNCRLVPDQKPAEMETLLRHHFTAAVAPGLQLQLRFGNSSAPVLLPLNHPAISAAVRAVEQTWESPPTYMRSGGSISSAAQLRERLGTPIVLLGFGSPEDNVHAANERFSVPTFFRAVETSIRMIAEYAA